MPTVDILISTYNEDRRMVATNALTALSAYLTKRYELRRRQPRGHAGDVRALRHRLHHPEEANSHGKAGNINHALGETSGELILLLDADFIVKEAF